jgi:hypothetical protein
MEIKETKDALIAVNILSIFLIEQFRDGFQMSDFMDLYAKITTDDAFKTRMMDAYIGISAIPAELKDLDVKESIELTSLQLSFLPKIIDVLKKKPTDDAS